MLRLSRWLTGRRTCSGEDFQEPACSARSILSSAQQYDLCIFAKWRMGHSPNPSSTTRLDRLPVLWISFEDPGSTSQAEVQKTSSMLNKNLFLNEHFRLKPFSKEILFLERQGVMTYNFTQAKSTCILLPNCDKLTWFSQLRKLQQGNAISSH